MSGPSSGGGGVAKKARIEIIPLIDVIFFLLATFVLFTLALNRSNGLPVKLPETYTGGPRDPANSVTLTVTAEGTIAWDKEPVTLEEFITRIKAYQQQDPLNAKVLINGDDNALFTQAIYVFDEVRKAGIQKVYIETLTAGE
jgi:biopolymer transport protein ExbD